ncbi:MAG TPA: macro domain-containing protein [Myxococcota bacterium]|nr:macro domain-containing protein [Myxococcota bacterium]HRY96336.1 macro domain-containing protein [Myxococcota bacterium]HSA24255.1 macro domain-containing protein [Myxococcota bacterium]
MQRSFGRGSLELWQGDITRLAVDAVTTAANSGLRGGGGVDGAVHHAAGPRLLAACRGLGGCRTGSAVLTPAFDLADRGVRHVIHAVGPIWRGGEADEDRMLVGAYRRSLELAEEHACASLAFPSISTGVYGFPAARAAPLALATVRDFLAAEPAPAHLRRVVFALFDRPTLDVYARALEAL